MFYGESKSAKGGSNPRGVQIRCDTCNGNGLNRRKNRLCNRALTTTLTHNSKSFILFIYFNGASSSPFAAFSVNNKGCEEEAIITNYIVPISQMPFFKWSFRCRCRPLLLLVWTLVIPQYYQFVMYNILTLHCYTQVAKTQDLSVVAGLIEVHVPEIRHIWRPIARKAVDCAESVSHLSLSGGYHGRVRL